MQRSADMTEAKARRIGLATIAAFLLAIVDAWHGVAFLRHPLSEGIGAGTGVWMLIDLAGAVLGCALAVFYLRHLYSSPAAPANRPVWTLLILVLGPFVMPFYWWLHLRQVPASPVGLVPAGLITEEEKRLLAVATVAPPTASVAPPAPRDTP